MATENELLREILAFCKRHDGMRETTFGRKAVNSSRLIGDLREGRSITFRRANRVRKFMKRKDKEAGFEQGSDKSG